MGRGRGPGYYDEGGVWVSTRGLERAVRQAQRGRSNRSFPANNGTVDGQPAYVQQSGDRTVAYSGPDNVGKVVTNDGENASYFRNDDGHVVVNEAADDPYNSGWNAH